MSLIISNFHASTKGIKRERERGGEKKPYPNFNGATLLKFPIKNIIIVTNSSHHSNHQSLLLLPTSYLQNQPLHVNTAGFFVVVASTQIN